MTDMDRQDHPDQRTARLLADLERLAGRLDRERFPGPAWAASTAAPPRRHGRLLRLGVAAAALAAGLLLSVLLYQRSIGPDRSAPPAPMAYLPPVPAPVPPTPALRPLPTMLDAAVLAYMQLGVPDVTLPAPVPTGSQAGGPDSYTWEIPEIHLPEL